MRWAAAESKRMREPGHVVSGQRPARVAMERRPSSVCTVLSQAREFHGTKRSPQWRQVSSSG